MPMVMVEDNKLQVQSSKIKINCMNQRKTVSSRCARRKKWDARQRIPTTVGRRCRAAQSEPWAFLKNIRRQFGELGAFALLQFDVRGDGLGPELADDVVEAVGRRVHVGIVDLVRVAGENNLRPVTDARDDGFDFERCEIL